MTIKSKAIILDLDGTLCRLKAPIDRNNHTGDELPVYDIQSFRNLIQQAMLGKKPIYIFILTGRKEKYRGITVRWLAKYDIYYDGLIMQQGDTALPNAIYKDNILAELAKTYDIIDLYDDNRDMETVCEKYNIPFTQC
jgi:FMN phosphatase YigB (HAD superfamily)